MNPGPLPSRSLALTAELSRPFQLSSFLILRLGTINNALICIACFCCDLDAWQQDSTRIQLPGTDASDEIL